MKYFPTAIFLLASAAQAAPLLGTSGSFFESGVCKAYRCNLSSREPLGAGVFDFRYTFAPERPPRQGDIPEAGPTLSVIRVNNLVTSVGYEQAAQDNILYPGTYLTQLLSRTFTLAAGASVSEAALIQLERRCFGAADKEVTLKVGRFTVSCLNSFGEYASARRVALRIHR